MGNVWDNDSPRRPRAPKPPKKGSGGASGTTVSIAIVLLAAPVTVFASAIACLVLNR